MLESPEAPSAARADLASGAGGISHRMRLHPATAALAVAIGAAGVVLLYAGRHLTFFYDEWTFVLLRRGGSISTYLDPHNGHLSLFPVVIYKLLFKLVGLRHYWPYRAVLVALDLASSVLLYALAARRIGRWLAIAPALLLALIGSAYQDLVWPFQIGFVGSVAGGLGALLVIEARAATRKSDALATVLVIYSVASSSVGLAFAVAVAVALLVRGEWRRGLVIIGIPLVLYAIWYAGWGMSQPTAAVGASRSTSSRRRTQGSRESPARESPLAPSSRSPARWQSPRWRGGGSAK